MIQEAYVSFETAKLLKEKGFNETVHYEYHYTISIPQFHKKSHNFNGDEYVNCSSEWYSAPTQQMAMAWLREVHNLFIVIDRRYFVVDKISHIASGFKYSIEIKAINTKYVHTDYESFEEAAETAIKYCLENLI